MTPLKCKNQGCSIVFKRKDKEKHDAICLFKPIKCQDCCKLFPKKTLMLHKKVCPMTIIDCCFKNVGCKEKKTRESMNQHMGSVQYHLKLSNEHILKRVLLLEKNCISLINENKVLREENLSLRKEFNSHFTILRNKMHKLERSQRKLLLEKQKKQCFVKEIKSFEEKCNSLANENKILKEENISIREEFNEQLTTMKNEMHKLKLSQEKLLLENVNRNDFMAEVRGVEENEMSKDRVDNDIKNEQVIKINELEADSSKIGTFLENVLSTDDCRKNFTFGRRCIKKGNEYGSQSSCIVGLVDLSGLKGQTIDSIETYLIEKDFSDCVQKIIESNIEFSKFKKCLTHLLKLPTSYIFNHNYYGTIYCFHLSSIIHYDYGIFPRDKQLRFSRSFGGSFMFQGRGRYSMMYNGHIHQFGDFESDKSFSCLIDFETFFNKKNSKWKIPPQYCLIWKQDEF